MNVMIKKNGVRVPIRQTRAILLLLLALLLTVVTSLASAQAPAKAKVFIAFAGPPGPAEQALVENNGGEIKYTYNVVPAIASTVPVTAIQGLRNHPQVTAVEPDIEAQLTDGELDAAWGVKRIGAGAVHAQGILGSGVKVGIIDSGIDLDHPDLTNDPTCSASFVDGESLEDGNGHGTHIAGILAALDNDSGVVGVAPAVNLCVYKVFSDAGTSSYSDIVAAIERAVADGVQIINNSYGSLGDPGTVVQEAFDNAYAAGVLNVAAAGNYGSSDGTVDNCIYPARWDSVIATANTTQSDLRSSSSSSCPEVELAAPGDQIYSTLPGSYGFKSGTSMASPHVAGTAALILSSNPTWTNEQVRTLLQITADDLGAPGRDNWYGFGLVDADMAVQNAAPAEPPSMHVGDLEGQSINNSKSWQVQVTITVHDENHQPVSSAKITGSWSGDWAGSSSCNTTADGTCSMLSGDIPKKGNSTIFTVTGVDHADFKYSPSVNHDPQGNSSGTAVQVDKNGSTSDPDAVPNRTPTARFTYSCNGLTCSFDGSGSSDSDGSIVTYNWGFGDGRSTSGMIVNHTFSSSGTYVVALNVIDDGGATGNSNQNVSVSNESAGISLSAEGYKVKGVQHIDLTWSGAGTVTVDVYRDGLKIASTNNDGFYTDSTGAKGGGNYQYQLCSTSLVADCSNTVQVDF